MKYQKKLKDLYIKDLYISETLILFCLKNGNQQEILISDIVKIYIEINKRKIFKYTPLFILPLFLLLFSFDGYMLVIISMLYLNLIIYLVNKVITQKFKFKLIIQNSNLEKLEFKFKRDIKYKIIDTISLIRKTNKSIL